MGAFIRQCLSRKALDKLLRKERSFFSSFSRSSKQHEPSLQDCEDAIAPLLDYLETNLKILNDNLSETNMQLVVLKIWKEILNTLENLVRPAPSSESQQAEIPPLDEYEEHIVLKWLEVHLNETWVFLSASPLILIVLFTASKSLFQRW